MNEKEIKYQNAKKRVEAVRGFYIHLAVYALVNPLLFLINIMTSPDSLWFFWPLMGWGIAVVIHAIATFSGGRMLGADWQERKIAEIMEDGSDS